MKTGTRIPAVFFDVYLDVFSRIIVPEIHLVCRLEEKLDAGRLLLALRLVLDAEPVAGSRYVDRWIAPYWKRLRPSELDRSTLLVTKEVSEDRSENDLVRAFLAERLPAYGPRAGALVVSSSSGDTLTLKVDHRIADAAAVKAFSYLLCETYQRLGKDLGFIPKRNSGPRGVDQVLARVPPGRRADFFPLAFKEALSVSKPFATLTFSCRGSKEANPAFAIRTWDAGRVRLAMEKARVHGATINDLMLTAYLRALAAETRWEPGRALRVMGTVDVRRYLPVSAAPGMANLSSMYCLNLENRLGKNLPETLTRVKTIMDRGKENFLGLPLMAGGMILIGLLPAALKKPAVAGPMLMGGRRDNFPPGYTNLGSIDASRLAFGGTFPREAFCVTPATQPPFFVLGFSGFSGTLTVSTGFFSSPAIEARVNSLLDRMEKELFGCVNEG